jgi:hypothetical protein
MESFMKFISHNAYAIVVMEGVDFCPAARLVTYSKKKKGKKKG